MELTSAKIIPWQQDALRKQDRLHQVSLSSSLLNINWQETLPAIFEKKSGEEKMLFELKICSYQQGKEFLAEHGKELFGENTINQNFLMLEFSPNKESYYQQFVDHFSISIEGRMVGYACIHLQDWSTYYLRYINVLPEYRGHKLVVDFVETVAKTLKEAGLERIETHVAVHNASQISKLVRLGFVANGNYQSERWGNMILLTKFLSLKHKETFNRQFCL